MRIKGSINIETDGEGAYEATVDEEYDRVEDAVTDLVSRLNTALAE